MVGTKTAPVTRNRCFSVMLHVTVMLHVMLLRRPFTPTPSHLEECTFDGKQSLLLLPFHYCRRIVN